MLELGKLEAVGPEQDSSRGDACSPRPPCAQLFQTGNSSVGLGWFCQICNYARPHEEGKQGHHMLVFYVLKMMKTCCQLNYNMPSIRGLHPEFRDQNVGGIFKNERAMLCPLV